MGQELVGGSLTFVAQTRGFSPQEHHPYPIRMCSFANMERHILTPTEILSKRAYPLFIDYKTIFYRLYITNKFKIVRRFARKKELSEERKQTGSAKIRKDCLSTGQDIKNQ